MNNICPGTFVTLAQYSDVADPFYTYRQINLRSDVSGINYARNAIFTTLDIALVIASSEAGIGVVFLLTSTGCFGWAPMIDVVAI